MHTMHTFEVFSDYGASSEYPVGLLVDTPGSQGGEMESLSLVTSKLHHLNHFIRSMDLLFGCSSVQSWDNIGEPISSCRLFRIIICNDLVSFEIEKNGPCSSLCHKHEHKMKLLLFFCRKQTIADVCCNTVQVPCFKTGLRTVEVLYITKAILFWSHVCCSSATHSFSYSLGVAILCASLRAAKWGTSETQLTRHILFWKASIRTTSNLIYYCSLIWFDNPCLFDNFWLKVAVRMRPFFGAAVASSVSKKLQPASGWKLDLRWQLWA